MFGVTINWAEVAAAVAEMNKALEIFEDALNQQKSAANELAGKWEGATKVAFQGKQNDINNWHSEVLKYGRQASSNITKSMDQYKAKEAEIGNVVKG